MAVTKLQNMVNPQVMADMLSASLPKKIKFTPIAKVDTTLQGRPGDTITVPKYAYIGDAKDVPEGTQIDISLLTTSTTTATVKKAGKGVELTDEALLSGYGDPLGEATNQLGMAIASKVDSDCYDALVGATTKYDGTGALISYNAIVDAIGLFADENDDGTERVIFVHPDQVPTLQKDSNFMDKNKYPLDVVMTGVIGKIAGAQVVKSKRVKIVKYEKDNTNGTITIVSDVTTEDSTHKHLDTITPNCIDVLAVGDKVKAVATEFYANPIITVDVTDGDTGTDTGLSALTIYMKRDVVVESDRDITTKTTVVTADEHFTAVLSNDSKVVLAKIKK